MISEKFLLFLGEPRFDINVTVPPYMVEMPGIVIQGVVLVK